MLAMGNITTVERTPPVPLKRRASLADWATAAELVDIKQAAFLLGADDAAIMRLVNEGGVDVVEHGGQVQIVTQSLREWQDLYFDLFGGEGMTEYLSVQEAADISGYSAEYIRQMLRAGKLDYERKSGVFWIHRDSLEAYMAKVKELGTQRFNWRRSVDQ